jgi:molecular chaperone DnaK
MIRESEVNAENDKRKRDLIEEINKAESIMHDTESKMEEFKTQLPVQEYDSLKVQISQIKEKILKIDRENDSIDIIKPLVDEFQKSSLKLFEMAYKKVFFFSFFEKQFSIQFFKMHDERASKEQAPPKSNEEPKNE